MWVKADGKPIARRLRPSLDTHLRDRAHTGLIRLSCLESLPSQLTPHVDRDFCATCCARSILLEVCATSIDSHPLPAPHSVNSALTHPPQHCCGSLQLLSTSSAPQAQQHLRPRQGSLRLCTACLEGSRMELSQGTSIERKTTYTRRFSGALRASPRCYIRGSSSS